MIIGIDEVGDFAVDSKKFNFFIGVHLDQNNKGIEIKRQQFENWLSEIPKHKINQHGEVKGKDLTDDQLFKFADAIIATEPLVRLTQIRIVTAENPPDLVDKFKKIEILKFQKAVEFYKKNNKPKYAKAYEQLILWYRNRNYQQYLKLVILHQIIPKALNQTIGYSILLSLLKNGSNDNLLNIRFKIDRDFINGPEPKLFWDVLLRNAFENSTKKNPVPLLVDWQNTGHPFLEKYGTTDGRVDFQEILRDNCSFHHSHEHFEIQMADITGNIIHRFQNKQRCKHAYNKMFEKFIVKEHDIIHLRLNPNPK